MSQHCVQLSNAHISLKSQSVNMRDTHTQSPPAKSINRHTFDMLNCILIELLDFDCQMLNKMCFFSRFVLALLGLNSKQQQ